MKDKAIFKKWWFWVIVVVVLGAIGAATQSNGETTDTGDANSSQAADTSNVASSLPALNAEDYKDKEGLVVYKDLKAKGYRVDAEFENQALTDINGKAADLFEPLDINNAEDRQSVDAFIVGGLKQAGDNVTLLIVKSSN